MVGRPIPSTTETSMVSVSAASGTPPEAMTINPATFEPSPVIAKTPAIMPAAAQATAIDITERVPDSSASRVRDTNNLALALSRSS